MSVSSDSRAADSVWSGECSVDPGGTRLVKLLRDRRLLVCDGAQVRRRFANIKKSFEKLALILSSCELPWVILADITELVDKRYKVSLQSNVVPII